VAIPCDRGRDRLFIGRPGWHFRRGDNYRCRRLRRWGLRKCNSSAFVRMSPFVCRGVRTSG
jgi:hypothetical protein